MDLKKAFEILKKTYGNHSRAAVAIAYSPAYYRMIRAKVTAGEIVPPRTVEWITMKAERCLAAHNDAV